MVDKWYFNMSACVNLRCQHHSPISMLVTTLCSIGCIFVMHFLKFIWPTCCAHGHGLVIILHSLLHLMEAQLDLNLYVSVENHLSFPVVVKATNERKDNSCCSEWQMKDKIMQRCCLSSAPLIICTQLIHSLIESLYFQDVFMWLLFSVWWLCYRFHLYLDIWYGIFFSPTVYVLARFWRNKLHGFYAHFLIVRPFSMVKWMLLITVQRKKWL